jgi:8-oxo-dGTP pyrophosphatase MutT (NUDIX family)
MKKFYSFTDELSSALNDSLPGRKAQFLMEPHTRRIELKKQKDRTNVKLSSVLMLLYPKGDKISTVMIKRPVYDGVHSGQIAFPGGRFEDKDSDLRDTALRETEEEIGVKRDSITIIGELTQLYIPPSNYNVQPVIGYTSDIPDFVLDQNEVVSILEINITDFLKPVNIQHKNVLSRNKLQLNVICYFIQNEIIWGASAMIISEFVEVLKKINLRS